MNKELKKNLIRKRRKQRRRRNKDEHLNQMETIFRVDAFKNL
jgi:hypothetical protein